ncbi:GAP1-N2 domain-containing protein [Geodermatophilus sp. URMC 64]
MLRAQFTYTATSKPSRWEAGAGWKIQSLAYATPKDEVPDDQLRQAVSNVGGFVPPPLPELPSQADADALPRCLRLDKLDDPLVCVSHVVAAGPDYSGRPNFYAHGLVVERSNYQADEHGILRPADLWGAEQWLRPLGAPAVDAASLDEGLDRLPWGSLDGDAVAAFLEERPEHAAFVFAAFERYLTTGKGALVVVSDAVDAAASWVWLLEQLLFPSDAWALPFSTYERLRDTTTPHSWPFAVVGVPAADAAIARRLDGQSFAVLDDDTGPIQTATGRWRLQDGTELEAGPWAKLAEKVISSPDFDSMAEQIEDLSTQCDEHPLEQPLWALGAAVLLLEKELSLENLKEAAEEIVREHYPATLAFGPMTEQKLRPYHVRRVVARPASYPPPLDATKPVTAAKSQHRHLKSEAGVAAGKPLVPVPRITPLTPHLRASKEPVTATPVRDPIMDVVHSALDRSRELPDSTLTPETTRGLGGLPVPSGALRVDALRHGGASANPRELLLTTSGHLEKLPRDVDLWGPDTEQWVDLAETLLRVDVRALPGVAFPLRAFDDDMAWDAGWQQLSNKHPDREARVVLAANLHCRRARATHILARDPASRWLRTCSEAVIGELLKCTQRKELLDVVETLVQGTPRMSSNTLAVARVEDLWRRAAVEQARRLTEV